MRTSMAHGVAYEAVRVLLADPPAFTPPYDHELAAALARAGADVELVTSRFRFGEAPEPEGYTRRELFYPLSSRVFGRSRLRLPVKVAEHPLGLASLRRDRRPTSCTCSGSPRPSSTRSSSGRTCRRCSPRTTSSRGAPRTAPTSGAGSSRASTGSSCTARAAATRSPSSASSRSGCASSRIPCSRATRRRHDDGRTVLAFGIIRPYKGLGDAIEAVRRAGDARLLVAGDPLEPVEPYRAAANGLDVEWRLGYLAARGDRPRVRRRDGRGLPLPARARPERRAAARARRRRPGGRVRRRRHRGAGARASGPAASCRPGDVDGLADAVHELLSDPDALEQARAGARRAREELTWDAAAQAHLAVYEEIA